MPIHVNKRYTRVSIIARIGPGHKANMSSSESQCFFLITEHKMTQGLSVFCTTSPRRAQHGKVANGERSKATWANLPRVVNPRGQMLKAGALPPLSIPELWICKMLNMAPGSGFQVPKA